MKELAGIVSAFVLAAGIVEPAVAVEDDVFDGILHRHVKSGVVDYAGIAGENAFAGYVEQLARADLPQGSADGLAFLINAYNALSIKGILDGGSPKSLLGRYRFFKRDKYNVSGESMNLFDLERKVIIPLGEPRIHFAIVCASASCPPLRGEVFDAARLDEQLDEQARLFINDPAKNSFDKVAGIARISRIFKWYRSEFEAAAGSLQAYLAEFVDDPDTADMLRRGEFKVRFQKYDWSLNGTPPG